MGDRLTDAELVENLKLIRAHGNATKAAKFVGIAPSAMRERKAEAELRGLTADTPIRDPLSKAQAEIRSLAATVKALQKDHDSAESIRRQIYSLAEHDPEPPAWVAPPVRPKGTRGVPVALWSDWHYGETVSPTEVNGVNEFNAEIAQRRIKTLVDTTIDLAFEHMGRAEKKYPGIVVCLGGDMISGAIHAELAESNDRTAHQAIDELTDLIASALEELASKFGKVFVPCVVGNHGRSTLKPRMKGRVYTSYEWNLYCNLARYFRRDPRIRFLIPGDTDAFFKVYNHRFLLTHGDSLGVKGGDGIIGAIGPIMRGSIKVRDSEIQMGKEIDTILMGHWHQMLWLPRAIVNNCLKGYDEFARLALRAPYSRPSQALFFVHPEHGITARWEVFLDGQRKAEEHEWLTWAAE